MVAKFRISGDLKTIAFLVGTEKFVRATTSRGIGKAAEFLKGEVKQSVRGARAEPRSIDTGEFLNSVNDRKLEELKAEVFSDVKQALFLEFGTTRIPERRHFRNSASRNKREILKKIGIG